MELLRTLGAAAAESRLAIKAAALEVIGEANRGGANVELLRIEAAPVHVFRAPGERDDCDPLFYVHMLLYDDDGVEAVESFTSTP